jgi:hypothetical protein
VSSDLVKDHNNGYVEENGIERRTPERKGELLSWGGIALERPDA